MVEPIFLENKNEEDGKMLDKQRIQDVLPTNHLLSVRWQHSKISVASFCPSLPNILLGIFIELNFPHFSQLFSPVQQEQSSAFGTLTWERK